MAAKIQCDCYVGGVIANTSVHPTPSNDTLAVGGHCVLSSVDTCDSYDWSIIYAPPQTDGSPDTSVISGTGQSVSFTPETEGAFLVRLTTVTSGVTSSEIARLRVMTAFGNVPLTAFGERYDSGGSVPVDATVNGWADSLNLASKRVLAQVQRVAAGNRCFYVDPANGDFQTIGAAISQAAILDPTPDNPCVVYVNPGNYVENINFLPNIHVIGLGGKPFLYPAFLTGGATFGATPVSVEDPTGLGHTVDAGVAGDMTIVQGIMFSNSTGNEHYLLTVQEANLVLNNCVLYQDANQYDQGGALLVNSGLCVGSGNYIYSNAASNATVVPGTNSTAAAGIKLMTGGSRPPTCQMADTTIASMAVGIMTTASGEVDLVGGSVQGGPCGVYGLGNFSANGTDISGTKGIFADTRWLSAGQTVGTQITLRSCQVQSDITVDASRLASGTFISVSALACDIEGSNPGVVILNSSDSNVQVNQALSAEWILASPGTSLASALTTLGTDVSTAQGTANTGVSNAATAQGTANAALPKAGGAMTGLVSWYGTSMPNAKKASWSSGDSRFETTTDDQPGQKLVTWIDFATTPIVAGSNVAVLVVCSTASANDAPIATLSCASLGLRLESCLPSGSGFVCSLTNSSASDIEVVAQLVIMR